MINRLLLCIFIVTIGFFSCKKEKIVKNETKTTAVDTLKKITKKDIRSIGETLLPAAKKKVKNWKEYQQLDELLTRFYTISPEEALDISKELSRLTKQLKDSVKIKRFKENDISIRINVLHNDVLRLVDMSAIEAIKNTEVKNEIQNILNAFSALNSKINNITNQERLEAEVKDIKIE